MPIAALSRPLNGGAQAIFITKAFVGEPVGLLEIDEELWQVKYGPILLGTFKGRNQWRRT